MLYIEEEYFKEVSNVLPIGLFMTKDPQEKETAFLERIAKYTKDPIVGDIVLVIPKKFAKYAETFDKLKIYFYNDENEELVYPNTMYPKVCHSESQIDHAIKRGYKIITIGQELLSNWRLLNKNIDKDIIFFSTPNNGKNGQFWIRPEGIKIYNNLISNWNINYVNNISNAIRRYQSGICASNEEDDIICGIPHKDQIGIGLLPEEFDQLRSQCEQDCIGCVKCKRILETFNKIPLKTQ